jgi:hypothetical protein
MTISTKNKVCHKCKDPAKFYDFRTRKWWCGYTVLVNGICKNANKKINN